MATKRAPPASPSRIRTARDVGALDFGDQCSYPAGIHANRAGRVCGIPNQKPVIHLAIGCDRPSFRLVADLAPSHLATLDHNQLTRRQAVRSSLLKFHSSILLLR